MTNQSILFQAKSFLCWDKFPELSIKLIPLGEPVGFFYPPENDLSTILLFYRKESKDHSEPLFFLFHEVGHFLQWKKYTNKNKLSVFRRLTNLDKGNEKVQFEKEAWTLGEKLFMEFINNNGFNPDDFIGKFTALKQKSLLTYQQ